MYGLAEGALCQFQLISSYAVATIRKGCVCSNLIRVVGEDTATLGKNLIEFIQGLEVFVDDGLVRQRP